MFDRFGNEFDVGDKVKIFKCENYPFLVGRIATVLPVYKDYFVDASKIRVLFDEHWQGYFNPIDVIKHDGHLRKIYKYEICVSDLNIITKSYVGYIREERNEYYCCLNDNESGVHFNVYKNELNDIKISHDDSDIYYKISGVIEFDEMDSDYKVKIKDLEKRVQEKFKERGLDRLTEAKKFIDKYNEICFS